MRVLGLLDLNLFRICFVRMNIMWRKIKYWLIKISRDRASTHEIAIGAAIGTFISIFPTFGAGTLLVLFFYRLWKFNLLAALGGSMVSNIFTSPFFMALSYKLGSLFFPSHAEINFRKWYNHLDHLSFSILVGSLILSFTLSLLAYYLIGWAVDRYRKSRPTGSIVTQDEAA